MVQDGDHHISCFDLTMMIEIIVEHKTNIFVIFSDFLLHIEFLNSKVLHSKCRHNDGVITHIGSETLSCIH